MNEPQWGRVASGGRERWNLTEWRNYNSLMRGMYTHTIGYIIKVKNKHRCRAWCVFSMDELNSVYVGRLDDMSRNEAKAAAKMLLLAQRSKHDV